MAILDCTPGFKFGCDPEVFIVNEKGEPVSPDMIPGTKEEPFPTRFGAVQRDGMAAEFNIHPAETFADFNRNIAETMTDLRTFLPKGYGVSIVPTVVFSEAEFEAAPDYAKVMGCSPDFDAWTGCVNPPPRDIDNPFLWSAAGHIHLGWGEGYTMDDTQHILNCHDIVKQLDWFLGAYSVSIDTDPARRRLYGRAGAHRPKSYGVEYRVLSNFWITSRERRLAIWNRLQLAIREMRSTYLPDLYPKTCNDRIIEYINETKRDPEVEQSFRYPLMTTQQGAARPRKVLHG